MRIHTYNIKTKWDWFVTVASLVICGSMALIYWTLQFIGKECVKLVYAR